MDKIRIVLSFAMMVFLFLVLCLQVGYAQPEAHGLPSRLASLTNLRLLHERADLTPAQRTDVLVSWLGEERRQPTLTRQGLGGGDIDSGYIQQQIIKALAELGDPVVVTQLVSSDQLADEGIRDWLYIALGLMGDRRQVQNLIDILDAPKEKEPDLRALAAIAVGELGAIEAEGSLARALQDGFTRRAGNSVMGLYTAYPVREAAEAGLRMLENPKALSAAKKRSQMFARRLDKARKYEMVRRTSPLVDQRTKTAQIPSKDRVSAVQSSGGKHQQSTQFPNATAIARKVDPLSQDKRQVVATRGLEQEKSAPVEPTPTSGRRMSALYWQLPAGIGGLAAVLVFVAFLALQFRNGRGNGGGA